MTRSKVAIRSLPKTYYDSVYHGGPMRWVRYERRYWRLWQSDSRRERRLASKRRSASWRASKRWNRELRNR